MAMSSSVTSTYSTALPSCCTVFTARWCWCSSVSVRMSVRYFGKSRRVRVRSSRKVSALA